MKPRQQGFTLIELAIVMVVLTILAAGVLVPLTKRIEIQRYEETQRVLAEARQALIGFAMSHKGANGKPYLPCPDKMTAMGLGSNLPNDGVEDRATDGSCETQEGNIPWTTLGVGRTDAWGNQLRYRVLTEYSTSTAGFDRYTKAANQIQVCTTPPTCLFTPADPPALVAVIVSHGPNGWGAINGNTPIGTNGVSQAFPTSADELENTDGDMIYISRAPTPASATTTEFDDVVVTLSQAVLVERVCFTGDCT